MTPYIMSGGQRLCTQGNPLFMCRYRSMGVDIGKTLPSPSITGMASAISVQTGGIQAAASFTCMAPPHGMMAQVSNTCSYIV